MASVTRGFPSSWRVTVNVQRSGGTDPKGIPLPTTEHEVADCLVSRDASEEQARMSDPETTCWLYAPVGSDFATGDIVEIPPGPYWPSGTHQATGRPSPYPLGMSVPLKEV